MVKLNIPTMKLNTGEEIPAIGYGTWMGINEKLEFIYEDIPKMKETLSYAIDIGYRHIDTAHLYRVEPDIGEVVEKKIQEGVVKREDLFITTKVWQTFHKEADVEVSLRASLKRLKLDYVDLVLIHWPLSFNEEGVDEKIDYLETWRGFEKVLKKGLTKAIGVSNFNVEQLKRLLDNSTVVPAVNQVEINLNLGQKDLVEFCQSKGIVVVAFTPFGTLIPRLSSGTPEDLPEPRINNSTLVSIAKKHNKTVTQISLRYLYERNIIAIPKTITKSRVMENASIFDIKLDADDIKNLSQFDVNYRTVKAEVFQDYVNYPFEKCPELNFPVPPAFLKWKNGKDNNID